MRTYTIEFDTTEMTKLIAICNSAIISEEKRLEIIPNNPMTEASIAKIKSIKAKIKNTILS